MVFDGLVTFTGDVKPIEVAAMLVLVQNSRVARD